MVSAIAMSIGAVYYLQPKSTDDTTTPTSITVRYFTDNDYYK